MLVDSTFTDAKESYTAKLKGELSFTMQSAHSESFMTERDKVFESNTWVDSFDIS